MEKKELKRLCFDIDNVLAKTDILMRKIIKNETKSRVCLSYNDIIYFDYRKCKDKNNNQITSEEWHRVHNIFSKEINIMSIEPFEKVQSHLTTLIESGYEIHLATSRLEQARIATIKWLKENNFPNSMRLHFLNHGEKHKVLSNFIAIVEDDLEQAYNFVQNGIKAYVIKHPWNELNNKIENEYIIRINDLEYLLGELI